MNPKNRQENTPPILAKLRQEQRLENTPLRAFEMWMREQEEEAWQMHQAEDRNRKALAEKGEDWSEADERSACALKVFTACGATLEHISIFKALLAHEHQSRP